jgi:hypothetical protein
MKSNEIIELLLLEDDDVEIQDEKFDDQESINPKNKRRRIFS